MAALLMSCLSSIVWTFRVLSVRRDGGGKQGREGGREGEGKEGGMREGGKQGRGKEVGIKEDREQSA